MLGDGKKQYWLNGCKISFLKFLYNFYNKKICDLRKLVLNGFKI
jgi:hypothetical protein